MVASVFLAAFWSGLSPLLSIFITLSLVLLLTIGAHLHLAVAAYAAAAALATALMLIDTTGVFMFFVIAFLALVLYFSRRTDMRIPCLGALSALAVEGALVFSLVMLTTV
jgi:hypothetical protein